MNKLYKKILELKYLPKFMKVLIIISINWTFQSILYMDTSEKLLKIFLDLFLFSIFFMALINYFNLLNLIFLSFIIAHTLNWLFNGHLFALLKTFYLTNNTSDQFIEYLNGLTRRASKESSILIVASFGSLSRKELKKNSDLDVRLVRKEGIVNGFRSSLFVVLERSRALFRGFPLDIYVVSNSNKFLELSEEPVYNFKR